MARKRILIIGGVAGGATAAARARREDESAQITILEKGPYVSFANCGLPYYIAGEIEKRDDLLLQSPEAFKERYNIDVLINHEAVDIDRENKTVAAVTSDGGEAEFSYDVLILTQGGSPVKPPIPGTDADHVFTLWTVPDVDAIDAYIRERKPKSAVVVGGGFIGLEMTEALHARGLHVTVVELLDQVLPNLDYEIASMVKNHIESKNIQVLTGTALQSVTPATHTAVLSDGREMSAELVLLAVGVRPTTDLAKRAGLEIGESGGVKVDDSLRTSDPNIYCAGDMMEVTNLVSGKNARIPLAGPANRQGRIAGSNAAGGNMTYAGALGTSVVKIFDATAGSTGLSKRAAKEAGFDADAVSIHRANHATYYPGSTPMTLRLVYDAGNGRVLGAQAFGFEGIDKRIDAMAMALRAGFTISNLAEADLTYAPPYSSANDAINMAAYVAVNSISGYAPAVEADDLFTRYSPETDLILDVRTEEEWNSGHLDAAVLIPVDELRERLEELPGDKTIYVHCAVGFRAHVAVRILKGSGFERAYNVTGGWTSMSLSPHFPGAVTV